MRAVVFVLAIVACVAGCPHGPGGGEGEAGEGEGSPGDAGFPPLSFECSMPVTCEDAGGQFTTTNAVKMCAPDANDAAAHACDSVDCGTATLISCGPAQCTRGGGCVCGFRETIQPCAQQ